MPKIKLPKSVQKSLGLRKRKFDLEDLVEELLKAVLRMVKNWIRGNGRPDETRTAVSPSYEKHKRHETAVSSTLVSSASSSISQAETYRHSIAELAQTARTELQKDRLTQLGQEMDIWIETVRQLENKISIFQQNRLLKKDLREVPKAIRKLEKQLKEAKNEAVKSELSRTLATRRTQLEKLQAVQGNMQAAALKIEGTVAQMGTIYSQALLAQSEGKLRTFERLVDEVDEEIDGLQNYLDALAEIRAG